jgi:mRNA interferase RelE/StbE
LIEWKLELSPPAHKDYDRLDGTQKKLVLRALNKILSNPLPNSEGGYGKPLSNRNGSKLAGLYKVKLRESGIRIVYRLKIVDAMVYVIVIGMRDDSTVYKEAERRSRLL